MRCINTIYQKRYRLGAKPFDKAKRENKPVLVSIGYAPCH
nr:MULTISPECIES: DUF255 domain-containing protein [Bacillus]